MVYNTDPDDIDVIIPANDDAIRAVKLITATGWISSKDVKADAAAEAESASGSSRFNEEIAEAEGDKCLIHK